MPLPLAALTRAAAGSGGGSSAVSGKVGHVEDMTPTYLADAKGTLEEAIKIAGWVVATEAADLANRKGGYMTTRNRSTGRFQKSAKARSKAGEPPFNQTGTLVDRIESETARTLFGEFIARVGAVGDAAEYGGYLELGTQNMQPRPYLRPAFDNKKDEVLKLIEAGQKAAASGKGSFRDPTSGRFMSGGG